MCIRQTTLTFALLLCSLMSMGQTGARCEYWFDSNYSAHQTLYDTDVTVMASVPLENMESGIHFFNLRAISGSSGVGKLFLTMFYLPDRQAQDVSVAHYEYWLDNAYTQRSVTETGDTLPVVSVSLADVAPGIHFFNLRAVNTAGEVGKLFRTMFYLPDRQARDISVAHYEYWLDNAYAQKSVTETGDTLPVMSVPLADVTPGIHFFNLRAVNTAGEVGKLFRTMFYLPDRQIGDVAVVGYEYWLDDAYLQRAVTYAQDVQDEQPAMSVSLEDIEPGIHFFNCRAFNSAGEVGKLFRTMFYVPEVSVDVSGYEYWFDNDTVNTVTVAHCSDLIEFDIDVRSLTEGEHTFNLRVRNGLERWGEVFVETFILTPVTSILDAAREDETFDVYSLSGLLLHKNVSRSGLLQLPPSVYIINGRKVLVK